MKTILVVDDDPLFRKSVIHQLTELDISAIEHDSGWRVESLIRQHQPVACIIDIVMAGKEGLETINEISKITEKPKIIAVSSNETYLGWAKYLGADAVLIKPVYSETLKTTLSELGI